MKTKFKTVEYVNGICASREKDLVGKERIFRMADAENLTSAYEILRETAFGGENSLPATEYATLIDCEEERLLKFVKEYAPSQEILSFCLIEKDFYNAEVLVKGQHIKTDCTNLLESEGLYSVEQITSLVNGEENKEICKELKNAVRESKIALNDGKGGMAVGSIFTNYKFAFLKKTVKSGYLAKLLTKQIDGINLCALLRAGDYQLAKEQIIAGGTLKEQQMVSISSRDLSLIKKALSDHYLKEIALKGAVCVADGKPLIDVERELSSLYANRMEEGKYTEQSGSFPFMRYYIRRKNEIACVRTVLTGKANSLDADQIKRRLITV